MPNIEEISHWDFWDMFIWCLQTSHFELDLGDMRAMDAVEGRH